MKKIKLILLPIAAGFMLFVLIFHYHKPSHQQTISTGSAHKPANSTTTKPQAVQTPSYRVGDSQTVDSLTIKLNKISTEPASNDPGGGIANRSDILLSVELTITNNGTIPAKQSSDSGVFAKSVIYTSDNKYLYPYQGNLGFGCTNRFGFYGVPYIAPGDTQTGCVIFEIPNNTLVDTYFYGDAKWYL